MVYSSEIQGDPAPGIAGLLDTAIDMVRDIESSHQRILGLVGRAHSADCRVDVLFCMEQGPIKLDIADDAMILGESVLADLVRETINAAAGDLQRQIHDVLSHARWSIGDVVWVQCSLAARREVLDDVAWSLVERLEKMARMLTKLDSVWTS